MTGVIKHCVHIKLDLPEFCIPYSSGNLLWKYRLQQPLQSTYFDDNGDLITTLTEFEPPDFWKEDELYLDEGEDCLVYNLSVFVCEKRGPKKSLSELLSPINFLPLSFFTPICLRLHSSPIEVWEGGGEGYLPTTMAFIRYYLLAWWLWDCAPSCHPKVFQFRIWFAKLLLKFCNNYNSTSFTLCHHQFNENVT